MVKVSTTVVPAPAGEANAFSSETGATTSGALAGGASAATPSIVPLSALVELT